MQYVIVAARILEVKHQRDRIQPSRCISDQRLEPTVVERKNKSGDIVCK